ncbi:LysR family transcriptional regulator [Burkholderia diffusa]|uniref:LysR family transcriptional regulator n=1 Tax=Burkholderia diffusa TaxID=488732 RepID=UPI0026521639|nr:LysR family transcriptional regulator [Burkholderia diffusa]MDN7907232.1 LysR family transcriptional regulator [Burkholderia diffusa]
MMNLLEAMPIFVAVVEHGGAPGASSDLKRGDAMACTDAGVAFHPCCRRTLAEVAQAIARIDACATVQDSLGGGFPPLETINRVDGASIAAPMPLHESSR